MRIAALDRLFLAFCFALASEAALFVGMFALSMIGPCGPAGWGTDLWSFIHYPSNKIASALGLNAEDGFRWLFVPAAVNLPLMVAGWFAILEFVDRVSRFRG